MLTGNRFALRSHLNKTLKLFNIFTLAIGFLSLANDQRLTTNSQSWSIREIKKPFCGFIKS